jgi:hypothetical protein
MNMQDIVRLKHFCLRRHLHVTFVSYLSQHTRTNYCSSCVIDKGVIFGSNLVWAHEKGSRLKFVELFRRIWLCLGLVKTQICKDSDLVHPIQISIDWNSKDACQNVECNTFTRWIGCSSVFDQKVVNQLWKSETHQNSSHFLSKNVKIVGH